MSSEQRPLTTYTITVLCACCGAVLCEDRTFQRYVCECGAQAWIKHANPVTGSFAVEWVS